MSVIAPLGPLTNSSSGFLRMREISPLLKKITQIVISILLAIVVGRGLYQLSLTAFKPSRKDTPSPIIDPVQEEPSLPKELSVRHLLQNPKGENRIMLRMFTPPSDLEGVLPINLERFLPKAFLEASLPYICFLQFSTIKRLDAFFNKQEVNSFYMSALKDPNPLNRFVCFVLIAPDVSPPDTCGLMHPQKHVFREDFKCPSSVTLTLRPQEGTENQESCRQFLEDLKHFRATLSLS